MLNLNTNQLDASISSGNGWEARTKQNQHTYMCWFWLLELALRSRTAVTIVKIHWVIWKNNGLFPNFWQWLMTCCKTEVSSTLTDDQLPLPFCCRSCLVENTTHWLEFHLKQRSCFKKKKCSSPWDSHITPVLFTWHLLLAMYSGACLNIEQLL